jgi:Rrf2 family transcriptional regulator, nitric oxide-sensitive transcriptional repressor
MKLTSFTDYSLRVLMFLAARPARRATVAEITEAFGVSAHHLTKVVHFLGKHGWIATVRGKGGGITLARPAHEIFIGRLVRDTEGDSVPAECFENGGGACVIAGCCSLKAVLAESVRAFYAVLDGYTLADVTRNRHQLVQVLQFQRPAQAVPA